MTGTKNLILVGVGAALLGGAITYTLVTAPKTTPVVQEQTTVATGGQHGPQGQPGQDCVGVLADVTKQDVSDKEKEDLLWMREEEKLARDVYLAMYDKWGLEVFKNIAKSEQRHMDAVKALLDRYNIPDPVKNEDARGVFTNKQLQELYDKLIAQGSKSKIDALKVGATIEDVDIRDLNEALKRTDNEDIKLVYESLKAGSYNHMRAFVGQLRQNGSDYTPQYITQEEFEQILNSTQQGGGHGRGRGPRGLRRGLVG